MHTTDQNKLLYVYYDINRYIFYIFIKNFKKIVLFKIIIFFGDIFKKEKKKIEKEKGKEIRLNIKRWKKCYIEKEKK